MKRMGVWVLLGVVVAAGVVSARRAGPVSGIDMTTFDKSVRPQDDFFRYVNGGWVDRTPIPADKASYGSFDILFDKTERDLRAIVEDAGKAGGAPGSDARKIGDFYASFMDEARPEALGATPLSAELAAIDKVATKADLARAFARLLKLGCDAPLQAFTEGDFKDPKATAFFVYQGGLGLPDRDYYLKDDAKLGEYRTKYTTFLASMHRLGGRLDSGRRRRRRDGARDAPREEPVDERRTARHPEDVQPGSPPRTSPGSSPVSTGPRGLGELKVAGLPALDRRSAELRQGAGGGRRRVAGGPLEAVPQVVADPRLRAVPVEGVRGRALRVLRQDAERHARAAAAVEAGAWRQSTATSGRCWAGSTSPGISRRRPRRAWRRWSPTCGSPTRTASTSSSG